IVRKPGWPGLTRPRAFRSELDLRQIARLLTLAQQADQSVPSGEDMLAQEARGFPHIAGPAFRHDLAVLAFGALAAIGVSKLHAGEAVGALEKLIDGRLHPWTSGPAIEHGMKLGVEGAPAARILGAELIAVFGEDLIELGIIGSRQVRGRFLEQGRLEKG